MTGDSCGRFQAASLAAAAALAELGSSQQPGTDRPSGGSASGRRQHQQTGEWPQTPAARMGGSRYSTMGRMKDLARQK